MNINEFNSRVNIPVTAEDYHAVEYVYNYHPSVPDCQGKDYIAGLYNLGGMGLIRSMIPLAQEGEEREKRLYALRQQRDAINKQIEAELSIIRKYRA